MPGTAGGDEGVEVWRPGRAPALFQVKSTPVGMMYRFTPTQVGRRRFEEMYGFGDFDESSC